MPTLPLHRNEIPDWRALTSLSEALTTTTVFSTERVPLSIEPFYELDRDLTAVIRESGADELKDVGARWAKLRPWSDLDVNPMDLAGLLLHLHSFFDSRGSEENSIFLWTESESFPPL